MAEYEAALVVSERARADASEAFDSILASCEADLEKTETELTRTGDVLARTKGHHQAAQDALVKTGTELASTKEKWDLDVDALWYTELALDAAKQDLVRTQAAQVNTERALIQAGEACAVERAEKNQAL